MKEKNTPLIFPISNSPLVSVDQAGNILRHEYWNDSNNTHGLREYISIQNKHNIYPQWQIAGPFPTEPHLYIGEYRGENNLTIFRTKPHYDPDRNNYPHRFTIREIVLFYSEQSPCISEETTEIFYGAPLDKKDAWNVFNKFAWLQDIRSALPAMFDKNEKEIQSTIDWCVFFSCSEKTLDHFLHKIPEIFRTVRDEPESLKNKDVLEAYIDFRKCMRGDYGRKDAKKMRDLFREWCIPSKNDVDSHKQHIAESLISKLAWHLDGVCRKLSRVPIKASNNSLKPISSSAYKKLMLWAQKNNEPRIAALSPGSISALLFNTKPFIKSFLSSGFGVSPKTLSRNK